MTGFNYCYYHYMLFNLSVCLLEASEWWMTKTHREKNRNLTHKLDVLQFLNTALWFPLVDTQWTYNQSSSVVLYQNFDLQGFIKLFSGSTQNVKTHSSPAAITEASDASVNDLQVICHDEKVKNVLGWGAKLVQMPIDWTQQVSMTGLKVINCT